MLEREGSGDGSVNPVAETCPPKEGERFGEELRATTGRSRSASLCSSSFRDHSRARCFALLMLIDE